MALFIRHREGISGELRFGIQINTVQHSITPISTLTIECVRVCGCTTLRKIVWPRTKGLPQKQSHEIDYWALAAQPVYGCIIAAEEYPLM